jgi:hypothetical protein
VDNNNNIVTDNDGSVTFSISGQAGEWVLPPYGTIAKVVNSSAGESNIKIRSLTVAGTIKISASVAGLQQGYIEVNTVAGPVTKMRVTVTPSEIFADETSTAVVTVEMFDVNWNQITNFNGQAVLVAAGPIRPVRETKTIIGGTTSFVLTAQSVAGGVKVRITNDSAGTEEVSMTAKPKNVSKIQVIASRALLFADGQDNTVIQAMLFDRDDNPVTTATDTVKFDVSGQGLFVTGQSVSTSCHISAMNGIAYVTVKSTTTTGNINITGTINVGTTTATSQPVVLTTMAQLEVKKIVLSIDNINLKANENITAVRAVMSDINGNKVETANDTVKFSIDGEANIMSGTDTVKMVYVQSTQGIAQMNIKSTKVTGNVTVSAESGQVEVTTVSFITKSGYPTTMVCTADKTVVAGNGKEKVKFAAYAIDANGNIAADYTSPVMFTITGYGEIETTVPVTPNMTGVAEITARSKVGVGTMTVTATSGSLYPGAVTVLVNPQPGYKILLMSDPVQVYSGEKSTVTAVIVDESGNITRSERTVTFSASGGSFSYAEVLSKDGISQSVFTGVNAGDVVITASADGLVSGNMNLTVVSSTKVVGMEIFTSTVVYVPIKYTARFCTVDNNNNKIGSINKDVVITLYGSNNEIIDSTVSKLVNGELSYTVYLNMSGKYSFKLSAAGLPDKTVNLYCMINRTVDNNVYSRIEYGDIKLYVSSNTFDKDVVLRIAKQTLSGTMRAAGFYDKNPANLAMRNNTAVELVAEDQAGNPTTVQFQSGKTVGLTLPYLDKNQDGSVDGTEIPEQNVRVWQQAGTGWQLAASDCQVDTNRNTVTVMISQLGVYAVMTAGIDPAIAKLVVYPNPFESDTKFAFVIGSQGDVTIDIYTVTGRLIKKLIKQVAVSDPENVVISYSGTDDKDEPIANGTYLYKVTAKNGDKKHVKTGKFTKVR